MARPLSAVPRQRGKRWTASVPTATGSVKRVYASFDTKAAASVWLRAAHAALEAGQPIPSSDLFVSAAPRRAKAPVASDFASVAWAWFAQTYETGDAAPERVEDVRRALRLHIIPFFAGRTLTVEELDQDDVLAYTSFMAGEREGDTQTTSPILPVRDYTLAEIAQLSGWSESSVHRAFAKGRFPNARVALEKSRRRVLVPTSDVIAAGFAASKDEAVPYGYSRTFVREHLNILRRILDYAMARKLASSNAALGVRSRRPRSGTKSRIPRTERPAEALLLGQVRELAAEMPLEGQVVVWLQRLAGLRVGESFGVFLDDLREVEGRMILQVVRQGGKKFRRRDAEGKVVEMDYTEELKTPAARRAIPISRHLAHFLEVFIEAAHGSEPPDLHVPLLTGLRPYSQQTYRKHLAQALTSANLGIADLGFHVTSHVFRKSLSSQMGYSPDLSLIARSKYLGHEIPNTEGSAPVTNQVYSLSMPRINELLSIADAIDEAVEVELGTIVVPAPSSRLLDSQTLRANGRRARAADVLDAHGYLAADVADGTEVVTREEAAELLGVSLGAVRKLLSSGKLNAVYRAAQRGAPCRMVTLASVEARLSREQALWTRRAVMKALGVTERGLETLVRHLGIEPVRLEGDSRQRFSDSMVEALRAHMSQVSALRGRALSVDQVAEQLGVRSSSVRRLLENGHLSLDIAATEQVGLKLVSRASLEDFLSRRERSRRRARLPGPRGTIPLLEAQRRLGLTRQETLALAGKGLVIHRLADYSFHVDEVGLDELAGG